MEIKITRNPVNFKTEEGILQDKQFPFVMEDLDSVIIIPDYEPGQKTYKIKKQANTFEEIIKLYQDCDSLEEFEKRVICRI